ncbi:MAG: metallophosphoesterase family protein [Chloroflexota bacterium]
MSKLCIIGDIHGQYYKLITLLQGANLINTDNQWTGQKTTLCFMGDFFDRGPNGIAAIDLVMSLQDQASKAGGHVYAILGNHELMLLAAHKFGVEPVTRWDQSFEAIWLRNGGKRHDMEGLTTAHLKWLRHLPAMLRVDEHLLIHSDSTAYLRYGQTIDEVNHKIRDMILNAPPPIWDQLLFDINLRQEFIHPQAEGIQRAKQFLNNFNAKQIIHGHTPISYLTHMPANKVTRPLFYADDLCVNVDGGMYMGGSGFVYDI